MVVKIKKILLTFDIEEFDLPVEFGKYISEEDQFEISRKGTENILDLLSKNRIKSTFFISAKFAKRYPDLIRRISKNHEVGLHCLDHNDDYIIMEEKEVLNKLRNAKKIIEKVIDQKIVSFRAPRFSPPSYKLLKLMDINYDSSYHPTYIPGRYNNLLKRRDIFSKDEIKVLPVSVAPVLRLPIFWIVFRNLPLLYSKFITLLNFWDQKYTCLVFHSWEFVDIQRHDIPFLIKRNTGSILASKIKKYIWFCLKKRYKFSTVRDYLSIN